MIARYRINYATAYIPSKQRAHPQVEKNPGQAISPNKAKAQNGTLLAQSGNCSPSAVRARLQ